VRYWPDRRAAGRSGGIRRVVPLDRPARAGTGIFSHRDVLASSAFCAVDTLTWSWSRHLTVEEVVIEARP
jgi:hypothetical protein